MITRSNRRAARRERRAVVIGQRRPDPIEISYTPTPDGEPDPGEVVWTWVGYEDDPSAGKDRPVLIIGRRGSDLVGLMLTSKDHDRDAAAEARAGRHWMDVGAGAWDSQRRPSEARLDRLLTIDPERVRREGAALPEPMFRTVVAACQQVRATRQR